MGFKAFIPNEGSNNVSVIDTSTNAITATITVGTNPLGVAM
jgi:YVTN family beta-propeller protein